MNQREVFPRALYLKDRILPVGCPRALYRSFPLAGCLRDMYHSWPYQTAGFLTGVQTR